MNIKNLKKQNRTDLFIVHIKFMSRIFHKNIKKKNKKKQLFPKSTIVFNSFQYQYVQIFPSFFSSLIIFIFLY